MIEISTKKTKKSTPLTTTSKSNSNRNDLLDSFININKKQKYFLGVNIL